MTSDIFRQRIEVIKENDRKLKEAIDQSFEKNPFISAQDSTAMPAEWVYHITEEHLKTLFLAVMDTDKAYSHVIEDWDKALEDYENLLKKLQDAGMDTFVYKPDERDCDRFVIDAEVDYYYAENNFGGEVEKDGRSYNLEDPEDLYEYLNTF